MLVPRREFRLALNRDSQVFLSLSIYLCYYNTNSSQEMFHFSFFLSFFRENDFPYDVVFLVSWKRSNATISRSTAQIFPPPIKSIVANQCFIERNSSIFFHRVSPRWKLQVKIVWRSLALSRGKCLRFPHPPRMHFPCGERTKSNAARQEKLPLFSQGGERISVTLGLQFGQSSRFESYRNVTAICIQGEYDLVNFTRIFLLRSFSWKDHP